MEPKKLGRYEVVEQLGQGAMGIVYRGIDPAIGRTVALKTLKTTGEIPENQLAEFKRRFSQEAQSAGRLQHPNIVTIYDVGEEEGLAYIAMELIKGKGLDEYIAEKHPFSIDQIVDIMAQICDGLGYAHRNSVVHRDIKPANIILTDDGKAKITDFGIAKVTSTSATQTGMVVGTPSYMSPEQITGRGVDNRSDIFSIGAVFYELLTHERAFPGDNITTVMYRVVHETPAPIATVNMAVPAQFQNILSRAMAKNPADRYPDAETMGKDIRNYRDIASAEMGATVMFKPTDVQGTVMMSGYNPPPQTGSPQGQSVSSAEQPSSKKSKWPVLAAAAVVLAIAGWFFLRPTTSSTADSSTVASGTAVLQLTANTLAGTILLDSIAHPITDGKAIVGGISPTEHQLIVRHDGYEDYRTNLVFADQETKQINVELKMTPIPMPAGVDTAYLSVKSSPDIVAVMTNTGRFVGYTPIERLPFPAGKHTLVFSRESYLNRTLDIDLKKNREEKLSPALVLKKGKLSIAGVTPSQVKLKIDGEPARPEKDGKTFVIGVGAHKIIAEAEGYAPVEQTVVISDTSDFVLEATLRRLYGSLSLTSVPSDAEVFVDGINKGKTPIKLDSIPAGNRDIRVQKGNLAGMKRVTVNENQETAAELRLSASVGYLKLIINPWGKVFVNGTAMGSSPPLDNLELKPGKYKIKIENPAYRAVTKDVTIQAGGSTTLQHNF